MKGQYVMMGNPKTKKLNRYHLIMGLTKSCNLAKCRQCYVEGIQKGGTSSSMKPETAKIVLKEFVSLAEKESKETAIAHFKGGEPLVYPYLEETTLFASRLGLDVFITTNGLAVVDKLKLLDRIQQDSKGKLRVTLSLNGSKPEIDAILRLDSTHYYSTIKAAKMLVSAGINFDINYVVHEGNARDLSAMSRLAKELGASQLNILQLILTGRAVKEGLRKAEPKQLLRMLLEIYKSGGKSKKSLLAGSLPDAIGGMKRGKYGEECVAGYRGLLYITPAGDVFSCPSTTDSRFLAGNIYSSNIGELVNSQALDRLRKLQICPGCKGDILSSGEQAENLRKVIMKEISTSSNDVKKSDVYPEKLLTLCVQKNW